MSRRSRARPARVVVRWLPLALALLPALAAAPAAMANMVDPAALEDPWHVAFELETIRVEGLRHVREELLLAEARLAAGRSYDEQQLGRAIDRIRRLPFVREASFALRKGSRRGLYELVVTIEETERFFFGATLRKSEVSDELLFEFDEDGVRDETDSGLLAGVRLFAGRYSTLFLAVEESRVVAGYTRSNLWGRPGSLRLGFEETIQDLFDTRTFGASVDPEFGPWSFLEARALTAAVDLPLSGADSWGLELEHRESDFGFRRVGIDVSSIYVFDDYSDQRLTASWLRDTTDDAVFAQRGLRQVVTATYRQLGADLYRPFFFGDPDDQIDARIGFESRSLRLGFLRSRWWTLANRHTVWGSVDVAVATTEIEGLPLALEDERGLRLPSPIVADVSYQSAELAASAGHRLRLFGDPRYGPAGESKRGAFREIYWETTFKASRDEAFGDPLVEGALIQVEASTGIVWRTAWGVFRIGFRLVDVEQDP